MGFGDRLKHAWNAFLKDSTYSKDVGPSYWANPSRPKLSRGNERTIVTSVFNRIAMDAAAIDVEHVQLDEENRYIETIKSGINNCLTVEANVDQTGRAFMQDVVLSMLDEGVVAIVPVDTDFNPTVTGSYDILTMRTAKIVEWYPQAVKVRLYNEDTGKYEEITLPKKIVAIVENPLYATVNEPNSTLQRLMRKLVLIDAVDEETGSGKLNMIIQLPYIIKTESRRQQAETRRKDIENQLASSKYGVAYADGTEKIMQLNRPLENNLLAQIEYLTSMLYGQLGITDAVLNGTASEEEMLNYYTRTIEPILSAITLEMKRKFLTKNARTRRQSIEFFMDHFKLVPVSTLGEIADTFTRNEIMSSNEFRQIIGLKPSDSPRADELVNKNMPVEDLGIQNEMQMVDPAAQQADYESMSGELDSLDSELDSLEASLNHSEEASLKHKAYASPYYDPEKAHEYYMKNRDLKGRRSLSGLNEEGKSMANYVKRQIDAERDAKIEEHRTKTDQSIKSSKDRMSSAIESNRKQTNASIKTNNAALESVLEANANQMNSEIQQEREHVKNEIKSHSSQMQSQIRQIQAQLDKMGPNQRKARKAEFQEKIDKLRDENAEKRDELNSAFSEFSTEKRSSNSSTSKKLRSENSEKNEELREDQKSANAKEKESHEEEKSKLNKEHKTEKKKIQEEYESKYDDELAKLFEDPNFLKVVEAKTSKGGGGRKKSSSSKSSSNKSSGGNYKSYKSRVKQIRKKYGT